MLDELKGAVELALFDPLSADLSAFYESLDNAIALAPDGLKLETAATGLLKIAELIAARAQWYLEQLQTHEDDEPVLTADELAGFVRQSMSLDLSEFLEVPTVSEPEPAQRSSSPRKKSPASSPEQTLSELFAIAHSENITDWMKVIARFMAVRRKATLAELVIELKMPWVEVWMGLLMDGQYQLTRSESEEEFYVSNFIVKLS